MSTRHGFYWNTEWAASLTQAARDKYAYNESLLLNFHTYKMTREEQEALWARLNMFREGEPCPDVTDTLTTVYHYKEYGTADGKKRQQALDEALQEIEDFLAADRPKQG